MKANELPINAFLQALNVQFVIPVYQRNYDWTTKECKALLEDIESIGSEKSATHFIGSIVFIYEGLYSTREVKELVIIDGQQRLTTINILYVALYRFAKENGRAQDADRLYDMFLTNKYVKNDSSKLKLKQTDNNSRAFQSILLGTERTYDNYSDVVENFLYFKSNITAENFEIIEQGLSRLIFVEIALERDKDDPQRIFESLNSTGLELSQSDLIRNFILMDLEPRDQQRVFDHIWNPIEENAFDINKQKSVVSAYIRDYLTLRNKKIPNKNNVYEEFKKRYVNKTEASYEQDLEDMKSLSVHYKKFINPSTVVDQNLRRELTYISRLEINTAYPFLLQVFEDAENGTIDNEVVLKILRLIQSFVWRRFIVGLPTNALNKIFMSLYSEIDVEDYYESLATVLVKKRGTSKFPTNSDVKTALLDKDVYNTQSKNRSYFFELLENHNNREYVDTSNDLITIEHIFPQNPHKDWEREISPDEYFKFKEKHLNTIGNLTLSGNNGSLSNKSFLAKKEMNESGKEQGYIYSRLWLNGYLKTLDEWSVETYTNRFQKIYDRFLNIWKFPDVIIQDDNNSVEATIFDADAPTGKKLEYYIFEDNKVEESHIAQMYFSVISELYSKNAQLLLDHPEIVTLSRNREDFRTGQELEVGYYVEANIDSNTKFRNLKGLLALYELEDELLIKYDDAENTSSGAKRFSIRREFWKQLIPQITGTDLYNNIKPTKDHWLNAGAGTTGVAFSIVITGKYTSVEIIMQSSSKETNKKYFHNLLREKENIEEIFGEKLIWQELPDHKMSRIKAELRGVNLFNDDDWSKMTEFIVSTLPRFTDAFIPFLMNLK